MKEDYGFVPDLLASTCQNVLGDMSPHQYFDNPHNLAFRDFTPSRHLPPATKLVLGLSFKFVQRPEASTRKKKRHGSFREVGEQLQL